MLNLIINQHELIFTLQWTYRLSIGHNRIIWQYCILSGTKLDEGVLASFQCFSGNIMYLKNSDATDWT